MAFWKKKAEVREEQVLEAPESAEADLLRAALSPDKVNKQMALDIPAVSACVNKISDTVASLSVKLYKRSDEGIAEEVTDDERVAILNSRTGDTLDAFQLKKALVTDMYLDKGGYAYIESSRGKVKSIRYVDPSAISFYTGTDPIFKDYRVLVNGKKYEGYKFLKLLRNTQNGWSGASIVDDSPLLLSILYATGVYERNLVKTGGNKKGFLESAHKLTKDAMKALKDAFRNLYSNSNENVVVLNEGLAFKESTNTSVEMQLNENKRTNSAEICEIFQIPPAIITGGATPEDKLLYYEGCIIPLLARFDTAINQVLLQESERGDYFFAFDYEELVKADLGTRYQAYETGLKNGFLQLDDVRKKEKLPSFGLDFIKLGLQDVLFYPDSKEIYTPNTNKMATIGEGEVQPAESDNNVPAATEKEQQEGGEKV